MRNFFVLFFFVAFAMPAMAQPPLCTPPPVPANPGTSVSPSVAPVAYRGLCYNESFDFVLIRDTVLFNFTVQVSSYILDSVTNIPPGLSVQTNQGSTFPQTYNTANGPTTGCMTFYGVPTALRSMQDTIFAYVTANTSFGPFATRLNLFIPVEEPATGYLSVDAGADQTIAAGGSANLNATPSTLVDPAACPAYTISYSWSPATGLSDPNIQNPVASPSSTTTYTVTINDGISTASDQVTITVAAAGGHTVALNTSNGQTTFCQGDDALLIATVTGGTGPFTYDFYRNGVLLVSGSPTVSVAEGGDYRVEVTDQGDNNSISSASLTLTFTAIPVASVSPTGPLTICPGTDQVLTYAGSVGGLSYQWLFNNTALPSATQNFYSASQPGQYRLVVSNSCGIDTSAAVVVGNHTVADPIAEQVGNSLVVTNANEFSSFVWTGPTGAAAGASATINPTTNGEYTVTARDANGCQTTASVNFTLTSRNDAALAAALSLYPNPSTHTATLRWNGYAGQTAQLQLTDLNGRVLLQMPITQAETALNISELPPGVYVLSVRQGGAHHSLMLVRQ